MPAMEANVKREIKEKKVFRANIVLFILIIINVHGIKNENIFTFKNRTHSHFAQTHTSTGTSSASPFHSIHSLTMLHLIFRFRSNFHFSNSFYTRSNRHRWNETFGAPLSTLRICPRRTKYKKYKTKKFFLMPRGNVTFFWCAKCFTHVFSFSLILFSLSANYNYTFATQNSLTRWVFIFRKEKKKKRAKLI